MKLVKENINNLDMSRYKYDEDIIIFPRHHAFISGLECENCYTLIWFATTKKLVSSISSPPVGCKCGPKYSSWRNNQISDYIESLDLSCPNCKNKIFSLVINHDINSLKKYKYKNYSSYAELEPGNDAYEVWFLKDLE